MLVSGLVSLNVHEALAFDGTEICLHPDLFLDSNVHSTPATRSSVLGGRDSRLSLNPTMVSHEDSATSASPPPPPPADTHLLQEGDMVELRVWDPRPGVLASSPRRAINSNRRSTSNAASIMRKRATGGSNSPMVARHTIAVTHSQPMNTSISMPPPLLSSLSVPVINTEGILDEPVETSNLEDPPTRQSLSSTNRSSHQSNGSEEHQANNNVVDSSSISSIHDQGSAASSLFPNLHSSRETIDQATPPMTSLTTSNNPTLPPVFPRSRANTNDSIVIARPATISKPPRHPSDEPAISQPPSTQARTRHVRDISDVTVDTAAYAGEDLASSPAQQQRKTIENREGDDETPVREDGFWDQLGQTHIMRLSFIISVTKKSLTSLSRGASRTQVSLLRKVAELYNLSSYDMVTVHKITPQDESRVLNTIAIDFLVLTIKDQFTSRGDMHVFQESLIGSWIYEGQRLHESTRGYTAYTRELRRGDGKAYSGIVTEDTNITFRSRSARFVWLIQISSEMYDYASPYQQGTREESRCDIYFDKLISFLQRLFAKWKETEVTHSLTVVFFSRTFVGGVQTGFVSSPEGHESKASVKRDVYGRQYEDHFRIVIENETTPEWDSLIARIKEPFLSYPAEVGWNVETGETARRPSPASQGNVLEAINVCLNLMQYHYLDRDLYRTGNSIFVVSAGNGVFEVDKGLAGITYQRMMDNGIGSDMLSLGLPPLHIAPFFLYVNMYQKAEAVGVDASESYYEVPHWMNLSFVSYDSTDSSFLGEGTDVQSKKKMGNKCALNPADLPVAANAFLLPRSKTEVQQEKVASSPLLRPASFSLHGNIASSPAKVHSLVNQERQLTSGREFGDILEACRPRHTSVIPSALRALIGSHAASGKETSENDQSVEQGSSELDQRPLRWGAIGRSQSQGTKPSALVRGRMLPGPDLVPLSPVGPNFVSAITSPRVDEVDFLDKSSPSSSFASQVSSYLLGVSFDRPLLSREGQLQRCPSMEFDRHGETLDSGDSVDNNSPRTTHNATNAPDQQISTESLRQMMRSFDSRAASIPSPLLKPQKNLGVVQPTEASSLIRHGSTGSNLTLAHKAPQRSFTATGSGGIGAALQQYRGGNYSSSSPGMDEEVPSSTRRTGSKSGLSGTRAGLRLFDASMGLSPLLLPPPAGEVFRESLADKRREHSAGPIVSSSFSRLRGPSNGIVLSSSPPNGSRHGRLRHDAGIVQHASLVRDPHRHSKPSYASKRKKAFNPFRQQDEDEVLATNSHNRRRWSHVFPMGELEFKRRNGPNIKSLTAPAILPLYVGYFPTQSEVDHSFTFSITNITLAEFDRSNYSSNKDLLMEMVRQRITQDFQLVPSSHVNTSNLRRETLREGLADRLNPSMRSTDHAEGTLRQFLSMGHRLQVLTYDPGQDTIEITRYDLKKNAQSAASETVNYHYKCYCAETKDYVEVLQNFQKYNKPYNWNKADRIVCGGEDRELREGMRFRRIMFGLLPPDFNGDANEEEAYTGKFLRLLDFLNRMREKDETASSDLGIRIVSSADRDDFQEDESTPGISRNSMRRFYVQLSKTKRGSSEWMEVVVDSTFNTAWSYRIMIHWMVASSGKVESQVQLLQRRCKAFGLDLRRFPQISVSRNVFVNPFRAPAFQVVRGKERIERLQRSVNAIDFVHDGTFFTDMQQILECTGVDDFDLGSRRWSKSVTGRQFVHRSGTLFVRILYDGKECAIVTVIGNYLLLAADDALTTISAAAFSALLRLINTTIS